MTARGIMVGITSHYFFCLPDHHVMSLPGGDIQHLECDTIHYIIIVFRAQLVYSVVMSTRGSSPHIVHNATYTVYGVV